MRGIGKTLIVTVAVLVSAPSACWSEDGPRKSPFWAIVASVTIPGGGQFYCENYVRGAIFCCAQASLTAVILHEHVLTEESLRRYRSSGLEKDYDEYSDHFDRRRDLLWWGAGVLVLSAADAFVDAHMYDFGKRSGVEVGLREGGGIGVRFKICF